jgi:hypothetical protein
MAIFALKNSILVKNDCKTSFFGKNIAIFGGKNIIFY